MEKDVLNIPSFGCLVKYFVLVFVLIFLDMFFGHSFLMSTKRSTILEIRVETFTEKVFPDFGFAIHDPNHKFLFRKKTKIMLYLQITLQFLKKANKKWT